MTQQGVSYPLGSDFAAALTFAAELHAGQIRKGGEIPYVGHLLSGAGLVVEAGGSEAQVIAAQHYIAHLQDASSDAVLVSLADKLDNARAILRDLCSQGSAVWDRFTIQDPQEHLWYYNALLDSSGVGATAGWSTSSTARS